MIRLLVMALWWPRVALFVLRLRPRLDAGSLPEFLAAITPAPDARRKAPALSAEETGRVVFNTLRWNVGPFRNGCFSRSFTRYHFFRVMGVPVTFHLGVEAGPPAEVRPSPPTGPATDPAESFAHLRGHAWLTHDGAPFLEWEPERFGRYREMYRFPPVGGSP